MTSGDLTFDLTNKVTKSDFFLIFDALSNATFPVSLRDPGDELEGGVQTPPPHTRSWKIQTDNGARVNLHLSLHVSGANVRVYAVTCPVK